MSSMPFRVRDLAIRFARHGCANRPFYHIVVIKTRKGQRKEPLDQIGSFDPMPNEHGEKLVAINYERFEYWYARGAEPTDPIKKLLGKHGCVPAQNMTALPFVVENKLSVAGSTQQELINALLPRNGKGGFEKLACR